MDSPQLKGGPLLLSPFLAERVSSAIKCCLIAHGTSFYSTAGGLFFARKASCLRRRNTSFLCFMISNLSVIVPLRMFWFRPSPLEKSMVNFFSFLLLMSLLLQRTVHGKRSPQGGSASLFLGGGVISFFSPFLPDDRMERGRFLQEPGRDLYGVTTLVLFFPLKK